MTLYLIRSHPTGAALSSFLYLIDHIIICSEQKLLSHAPAANTRSINIFIRPALR